MTLTFRTSTKHLVIRRASGFEYVHPQVTIVYNAQANAVDVALNLRAPKA